ncbi:DUF4468 domain-containing protein [Acinetobacter baumannii]|nr:DUF4468 domain-containing protein [Acinetobacter baumannii]
MKNYLLGVSLILGLTGCAGMPTPTDKPFTEVTQVVELPGQSKDKLFESSKIWMAKNFRSSNDVIQYADKNTGSIIGKGTIQYPCKGFMDCSAFGKDYIGFTLKIDTKDNKARISFADLTWKSMPSVNAGVVNRGGEFPLRTVQMQAQVKEKIDSIIEQYKSDVVKQQADNW